MGGMSVDPRGANLLTNLNGEKKETPSSLYCEVRKKRAPQEDERRGRRKGRYQGGWIAYTILSLWEEVLGNPGGKRRAEKDNGFQRSWPLGWLGGGEVGNVMTSGKKEKKPQEKKKKGGIF